jgi:hypothetical protein
MRLIGLSLSLGLIFTSACAGPIEDWVESSANADAIQEWLDEMRTHPLNLNAATVAEISRLPFFDLETAQRLFAARAASGGFTSVEQALAVPGLTDAQRESIELIAIVSVARVEHASVRAAHQVSARVTHSRLRGDFRSGDATRGFLYAANGPNATDFSAGVEFRRPETSTRLLMGDFQVESGTGLVFASAYGLANWLSSSVLAKPTAPRGLELKPTSSGLSRFRGAALEVRRLIWTGTILGSVQQLDGASDNNRITRITEGESATGDLSRARRNQVEERLAGVALEAKAFASRIGASAVHSRFSTTIEPALTPEDPVQFAGDNLDVGSLYLEGEVGRLNVVAEAAKSDPGGYAHQSALAVNGERLGASVYNIFAADDFYSLHSKVWGGFGDEANNLRQTGCKLRASWPREVVNLHAWDSHNPFRTSRFPLGRDASGVGVRSETEIARTVSITILADREWREEIEQNQPSLWQSNRARLETVVRGPYEFRLRFEIKSTGTEGSPNYSTGTLVFVQMRGDVRLVSYFLRVTIFDAEDNAVALRAYENSPIGASSLTALSGTGRRVAVMASRDLGVMAGAIKVAHTVNEHPDRDVSVDAALQLSFRW